MYGHILYHKEEHSVYVQSLFQDPRIRLVSSVEMFGFVPFLSGLVGFVQCIFEQTLINAENPKFVHVSKKAFETCVMKRFRANAGYTPMRFPVLPTTFNFRLPPTKGRSNYPQGKGQLIYRLTYGIERGTHRCHAGTLAHSTGVPGAGRCASSAWSCSALTSTRSSSSGGSRSAGPRWPGRRTSSRSSRSGAPALRSFGKKRSQTTGFLLHFLNNFNPIQF